MASGEGLCCFDYRESLDFGALLRSSSSIFENQCRFFDNDGCAARLGIRRDSPIFDATSIVKPLPVSVTSVEPIKGAGPRIATPTLLELLRNDYASPHLHTEAARSATDIYLDHIALPLQLFIPLGCALRAFRP